VQATGQNGGVTNFSASSPPAAPKKGGGLIWSGVVLLLLGIVGGAVLTVIGVTRIASEFERTVDVPGTATFNLPAGDYGVYVLSSSSGGLTPTVTITDPSGNTVTQRSGDANFNGNSNSQTVRSLSQFTARTSGNYTVEAESSSSSRTSTSQTVSVGAPPSALVGSVAALLGGGLCGGGLFVLVGLILLIVGLVSRSKGRKAAAAASYGGPGPGYGGPGYGGPGYGGPGQPGVAPGPAPGGPPPAPGAPPAYGAPPPAGPGAPPADPWNR
jgi:hypothetical protein